MGLDGVKGFVGGPWDRLQHEELYHAHSKYKKYQDGLFFRNPIYIVACSELIGKLCTNDSPFKEKKSGGVVVSKVIEF